MRAAMPKATVNEDGDILTNKCNVWFSGDVFGMQPITANASYQKHSSNFQFGPVPLDWLDLMELEIASLIACGLFCFAPLAW